jgi:hypothetical protein
MVALAAVLVVAAVVSITLTFTMTTDTGELISAKTPWRQDGLAVEAAFPQQKDSIIVVIDGQTPELAEDGAKRLMQALQADKTHVGSVERPDGGPFFDTNGLLFADPGEVKDATSKLVDAQPLLGGLAGTPACMDWPPPWTRWRAARPMARRMPRVWRRPARAVHRN